MKTRSYTVRPELVFPTIEDTNFSTAIRNAVNNLNLILEQAAKKKIYLSAEMEARKTSSGFTTVHCIRILDVVKCL